MIDLVMENLPGIKSWMAFVPCLEGWQGKAIGEFQASGVICLDLHFGKITLVFP